MVKGWERLEGKAIASTTEDATMEVVAMEFYKDGDVFSVRMERAVGGDGVVPLHEDVMENHEAFGPIIGEESITITSIFTDGANMGHDDPIGLRKWLSMMLDHFILLVIGFHFTGLQFIRTDGVGNGRRIAMTGIGLTERRKSLLNLAIVCERDNLLVH